MGSHWCGERPHWRPTVETDLCVTPSARTAASAAGTAHAQWTLSTAQRSKPRGRVTAVVSCVRAWPQFRVGAVRRKLRGQLVTTRRSGGSTWLVSLHPFGVKQKLHYSAETATVADVRAMVPSSHAARTRRGSHNRARATSATPAPGRHRLLVCCRRLARTRRVEARGVAHAGRRHGTRRRAGRAPYHRRQTMHAGCVLCVPARGRTTRRVVAT